MIASQKGLILCRITPENTFTIVSAVEEFVGLYGVNISWGGGHRYAVITSRPRFANKKDVPPGEENYAVISYTVYNGDQTDPDQRQVILGQYKTSFTQATFAISKVQVMIPRIHHGENFPDETIFRGRFFLSIIENHLKIIDTESMRLYDLLSEPNFDQEAVSGMSVIRSMKDRTTKLMMLCHRDGHSYIQRIDLNAVLPFTLHARGAKQMD